VGLIWSIFRLLTRIIQQPIAFPAFVVFVTGNPIIKSREDLGLCLVPDIKGATLVLSCGVPRGGKKFPHHPIFSTNYPNLSESRKNLVFMMREGVLK